MRSAARWRRCRCASSSIRGQPDLHPPALGERIGIRACPAMGFDLSRDDEPGCCRPEVFRTANGSVEACVARVPSVRFGAFELRNPRWR